MYTMLLGIPWIEPELREDRGEIEAAQEGRLPKLIQESQIRGDLHVHTRLQRWRLFDRGDRQSRSKARISICGDL